jgi:hypothetical protein
MPIPTPAANNIQTQDINPNSGTEFFPPSLIFPNGEIIKKKMISVKADIETENKEPNQTTTKFLVLESNSLDISGKINTRAEKITTKPELMENTGRFISSPRNWVFALLSPSDIKVLCAFSLI